MDLASLKKYACFGDGYMCAVVDRVDNVQRYVKLEDVVELLKHADNSAIPKLPSLVEVQSFIQREIWTGGLDNTRGCVAMAYEFISRQLSA